LVAGLRNHFFCILWQKIVLGYFYYLQAIEDYIFKLASSGSILIRTIIKMTERSDIHKYSIVNRQSSIPVYPGWV